MIHTKKEKTKKKFRIPANSNRRCREKSASRNISVDKQLVKKPGRVTPSLGKAEKQEGSGADSSLSTTLCCGLKKQKIWTRKYWGKGFSRIQRGHGVRLVSVSIDGGRARTQSAASRLVCQAVNGEWPFCA